MWSVKDRAAGSPREAVTSHQRALKMETRGITRIVPGVVLRPWPIAERVSWVYGRDSLQSTRQRRRKDVVPGMMYRRDNNVNDESTY